jgi:hypothetical protein
MKLSLENVKVLSSEKIVQNFNAWNDIQNSFDLKCVDSNMRYPKSLVIAALRRFNEIAESYHMDASKFCFVRVSGGGTTWQVDFHDDTNSTGCNVSIYDIYFDSNRRMIMQSCYALGG